MLDFHSHFLPRIDDGSSSLEESIAILQMMKEQGVTTVVATPHFYANHASVDHFLKKRDHACEKVMAHIESEGLDLPEIRLGAEVYYFDGIGKAEQVRSMCLQGTDILLLEMPFVQWTESMLRSVEQLVHRQKLTVVLAHIERYREFQKDMSVWNQIFDLPVIPQMNAGPFLNWKTRRKAFKLMELYEDVLLGSDSHNTKTRCPNILQGRQAIAKRLGEEQLARIDALGERIFLHD